VQTRSAPAWGRLQSGSIARAGSAPRGRRPFPSHAFPHHPPSGGSLTDALAMAPSPRDTAKGAPGR